ncbi:MAG: 5'-nucleotidase, partial [Calditrichaeota bacterium]|nr:5'-nucleotidase [Calditrichota bacterium]
AIAKEFRILLLIGDNANDFASDFFGPTTAERANLASQYASYWGTKWIVLPNPMYGSWEAAVFDYHFPDDQEEWVRRKIQALRFE